MSEGFVETDHDGRPVREFRLAVSTAALALAWARQDQAAHGAVVVADREVSPLGRLGRLWSHPPEATLACSVVLRPRLAATEADAVWLIGGLLALHAAEAATGRTLATTWPERVTDPESGHEVAMVKAEVQLGPGVVSLAVVTVRFDLTWLGVDRDQLLNAVLSNLDNACADLSDPDLGAAGVAARYEKRCDLVGQRCKIVLLPRGETRGTVRRVDRYGRIQLASATGMVEEVAIDGLRSLDVLPGAADAR